MLKHETRLIDPDQDAIVAALSAAVAGANKRCRTRLIEDDPAKWRKFAREVDKEPEGWDMFRGGRGGVPATQVLAAWWTDAIGRKHVVLRGRRVEHDEAKRLLQKDELAKRAPLWHAYPEYVCRRVMGGTEQLVCACGCGAVGTPDSLSWMGPMCGPCFDRKEELGPEGLYANAPGVLYGDRDPLGAVACSPDRTRVAAVEGNDKVTYWDLPARLRTTMEFSGHAVTDAAITSDARYLLVTGIGSVPETGLFAVFDLSTDPLTRLESAPGTDPMGWRVVALADPGFALLHRFPQNHRQSRIELIRVPTGEPVRGDTVPYSSHGRFSLSADGTRLVATGRGHAFTIYDVETLTAFVSVSTSGLGQVVLSHNGKHLFCETNGKLATRDADTGRPLFSVPTSDQRQIKEPGGYITALAAGPQGEFVYAGTSGGTLLVFTADRLGLRAQFEWHLGAITGLAVSADGSRLFSSGTDGCVKVWPIRDLLCGA